MGHKIKLGILGFALYALSACSGAGGSGSGVTTHVSGKAAKGAYLAQGSTVQIRSKGSSVSTTTVSDSQGGFSIDVTGAGPFLIRACDGDCSSTGTWYYSYLGSTTIQYSITAVADISGSLNNSYFLISGIDTVSQAEADYYVWFSVNNAGVDPALSSKTGIKVSLATNASASTVASAIASALSPYSSSFASASASGAVVSVMNAMSGNVPVAADGSVATGFSFESSAKGISNINPYTDLMIRAWYGEVCIVGGASIGANIDDLYVAGVYPSGTYICPSDDPPTVDTSRTLPDNTPIDLPNEVTIAKVQNLMSNIISNIYGINIENVLVNNWVQGEGFDALLDSTNTNDAIKFYLLGSNTLAGVMHKPDALNSSLIYSEVVVDQHLSTVNSTSINMHADIWTTSNSIVLSDYYDASVFPLSKQSDSTSTNNHYSGNKTVTSQTPLMNLEVDGDSGFQIPLSVVNYGVGTSLLTSFTGGIPSINLSVWKPITAGAGATVSSVSGTNVVIAVADLDPSSIVITDTSGNILGENDYNSLSPAWSGSDTVVLSGSAPSAFNVSVIAKDGQRTRIVYH